MWKLKKPISTEDYFSDYEEVEGEQYRSLVEVPTQSQARPCAHPPAPGSPRWDVLERQLGVFRGVAASGEGNVLFFSHFVC